MEERIIVRRVRGKFKKNCAVCQKEFLVTHSCLEYRKHCSKKCLYLFRSTLTGAKNPMWRGGRRKGPNCATCGKQLSSVFAKLCSKCWYAINRGKNHVSWRGVGKSLSSNSRTRNSSDSKLRHWRRQVLVRDNYTCQACGQAGGKLEVDHELPFAFYPQLRFEVLNGRVLCRPCHQKTPTYGRGGDVYSPLMTNFQI